MSMEELMQKTLLIKVKAWNEELQEFQEEIINPLYIQRIKPIGIKPIGNGSSEFTGIYLEGRPEILKLEYSFQKFAEVLQMSKVIIS